MKNSRMVCAVLFFCLLFAYAQSSQARCPVEYLHGKNQNPYKIETEVGEGVTPWVVDAYVDAITLLNHVLRSGNLPILKQVLLKINAAGDNAFHQGRYVPNSDHGHVIHVAEQLDLVGAGETVKSKAHPLKYLAVTLHEAGHGMLEEYISLQPTFLEYLKKRKGKDKNNFFASYREMVKLQSEDEYLLVNAEKIQAEMRLLRENDLVLNEDMIEAFTYELSSLIQRHNQITTRMNDINETAANEFYILGPYHEYMADVVAVMLSKYQPDAVSKALLSNSIYHTENAIQAIYRAKDKKRPPLDRETRAEEKAMIRSMKLRDFSINWRTKGFTEDEAHTALSPLRNHTWDTVLDNPLYRQHPALVLKIIMDVCNERALYELDLKTPLTPQKRNEQAQQALDEAFRFNRPLFNKTENRYKL